MTPNEFITKWRTSALKERSASQEHLLADAHAALDAAVAVAYGWSADITDAAAIRGLLDLG